MQRSFHTYIQAVYRRFTGGSPDKVALNDDHSQGDRLFIALSEYSTPLRWPWSLSWIQNSCECPELHIHDRERESTVIWRNYPSWHWVSDWAHGSCCPATTMLEHAMHSQSLVNLESVSIPIYLSIEHCMLGAIVVACSTDGDMEPFSLCVTSCLHKPKDKGTR